jgi:PAS domain S-box-containing protein
MAHSTDNPADPANHLADLRARVAELEAQLAQAKQDAALFQVLLDAIPDTIYFKDTHSRFMRINRAEAEHLELGNPRDAVGRTDSDFHVPEFASQTRADELTIMNSGIPIIGKIEHAVVKSGSVAWYSTTKVPFHDESGRIRGIVGIGRNVTKQVEAEEALRASEEQYRLLFRQMRNGFALHEIVLDEQGVPYDYTFVEVNPTFELMMKLRHADIAGRRAREVLANVDEELIKLFGRVALSGTPELVEHRDVVLERHFEVVVFSPQRGSFACLYTDRTSQTHALQALEDSHRLIQRVADVSPTALYIYNMHEQRLTYANQHALGVLGCTPDEMLTDGSRAYSRNVTVEGKPLNDSLLDRYAKLRDGEILESTLEVSRKDGLVRVLHAREVVFSRDHDGVVCEILGAAADISEKIDADRRLRESELRLRNITNNMLELVVQCDVNLNSTYLSPSYETVLGYPLDELIGTGMFWLIHPDDQRRVVEFTMECVRLRRSGEAEFRSMHKDGHYVWFQASGQPLYDEMGNFTGAIVVSRDVTARKQAEEALRKSDERYRHLVDNSRGIIACLDMSGRFIMINPGGAESLGYAPEEMVGRSFAEFMQSDGAKALPNYFTSIQKNKIVRGVCRLKNRDGQDRFWEYQDYCYEDDSGTPYIMAHALDVTTSHLAREELARSEERYRLIFQGTRDAITFVGKDGKRIVVNQRFSELTGYTMDELLLFHASDMCHPDDRSRVIENQRRRLAGEPAPRIYEYRLMHKDGHVIYIEGAFDVIRTDGEIIGVCAILRDISERKRAEEERLNLERQLLHVQKLESLGLLAGGIAHDFNNILVAILGNAELALLDLPPDSPAVRSLDEIRRAGVRASDLCRQMLAYSGRGKFVIETFSLNDHVREMGHLLRVSVSKRAVLQFDLDDELPSIEGDATQIRQVIMNLITNASEALDSGGGVIAVRTGSKELGAKEADALRTHGEIDPGLYCFVEISDTGTGMTPEVAARVFDPFFTTKFTGRGLGMAAVLGIVRGHNGSICLTSEVGKGTTFRVYFPASHQPFVARTGHQVANHEQWKGSGTVLIIDDEESVRNVGALALKRCDLQVLVAEDGVQGLDTFKENANGIDLVLLDLTMPKMDGEETLRGIRLIRPDVPVLMISGFSEREAIESLDQYGISGFMQKPFQIDHLIGTIRRILSQ